MKGTLFGEPKGKAPASWQGLSRHSKSRFALSNGSLPGEAKPCRGGLIPRLLFAADDPLRLGLKILLLLGSCGHRSFSLLTAQHTSGSGHRRRGPFA